jgi:geranylgeranyl pyrophosphate synthase
LSTLNPQNLDDKIPETVLDSAIAIEFIHQSSLVHDDVMDEDELRREKPTVWKVLSNLFLLCFINTNFETSHVMCYRSDSRHPSWATWARTPTN